MTPPRKKVCTECSYRVLYQVVFVPLRKLLSLLGNYKHWSTGINVSRLEVKRQIFTSQAIITLTLMWKDELSPVGSTLRSEWLRHVVKRSDGTNHQACGNQTNRVCLCPVSSIAFCLVHVHATCPTWTWSCECKQYCGVTAAHRLQTRTSRYMWPATRSLQSSHTVFLFWKLSDFCQGHYSNWPRRSWKYHKQTCLEG
jgi:hypothetical protein